MGHRHNRRRTRNRPRHRTATGFSIAAFPGIAASARTPADPPDNYYRGCSSYSLYPYHRYAHSRQHWQQQYEAWQSRIRQQEQERDQVRELKGVEQQKHNHMAEEECRRREQALEAHRIRFFGGEAGDEVSLCAPMLQVVLDLFNDIDYQDP